MLFYKFCRYLNVCAFIAVISVSWLSSALPIGGHTPKQISDMYPTLITPASYAFSIWGVIYMLLGGFILYPFFYSPPNLHSFTRISLWFIMSCGCNIAWIYLWQNQYIKLALVIILLLLFSLMNVYQQTHISSKSANSNKLLVQLPFRLYFAWVSVATILNATIVLSTLQWNRFGLSETTWAIMLLFGSTILSIMVSYVKRDIVFPIVFIWAYIAIAVQQQGVKAVYYNALFHALLLSLFTLWFFVHLKKTKCPEN